MRRDHKPKLHRLKYDHDDGRAGTKCGIELRRHDGRYRAMSFNPLRRVQNNWDRPICIAADDCEPTCSRCAYVRWDQRCRKIR